MKTLYFLFFPESKTFFGNCNQKSKVFFAVSAVFLEVDVGRF